MESNNRDSTSFRHIHFSIDIKTSNEILCIHHPLFSIVDGGYKLLGVIILELTKATPLYQQVRKEIHRLITEGRMTSGETLTETKLSEMFGISRTPVREALRQLTIEGLVQSEQSGFRVYSPTAEDVADIYVCRAAIEGQAAALLVARPTPALEELEVLVAASEEALQENSSEPLVSFNTQFHGLIVHAAGNPELSKLHDAILLRSVFCRSFTLRSAQARQRSATEHRQIINLIRQHDMSTESFLRNHVLRAGLRALNNLDPNGDVKTPSANYLRRWGSNEGGCIDV